LVVGAGGIGCELLKNLVCAGFGSGNTQTDLGASTTQDDGSLTAHTSRVPGIVLVDLDTIDLSNLNRQFLFRKQHIKKPKATVAKETASQFNPAVNIDARHGDIFDAEYNVDFFEGFDIVFNALDNLKECVWLLACRSSKVAPPASMDRSRRFKRELQNATTAIRSLCRKAFPFAQSDLRPHSPYTASCGPNHTFSPNSSELVRATQMWQ
jgi:hypothetical protein